MDGVSDKALVWVVRKKSLKVVSSSMLVRALGLILVIGAVGVLLSGRPDLFVPVAALLALLVAVELWREWRAPLEIALTPAARPERVTVLRVSGATSTHPIGDVRRVKITRVNYYFEWLRPASVKLVLARRTIRTHGFGNPLPDGWVEALTASGVPIISKLKDPYATPADGPDYCDD